jgi:hypothetical protein
MMRRKKSIPLRTVLIISMLMYSTGVFAVSAAVKSQEDYIFTLDTLREMRVIIENFGTPELKTQHEEIRAQFISASEEFYAQNYASSHQKFYNVKERLVTLLEAVSGMYIERTKNILDSTQKASFDIIIKYTKKGGILHYFKKPFNPVEDIKPYKEEEYHFFHDRETIERYIHRGYKKLEEAKNTLKEEDLKIIKNKKNKTSSNLDYMIERHQKAISDCRLAKQYGIEIHKLVKSNQVGDILRKYNLTGAALDPIFDDRIPEEYKVDANDNLKLIHAIEKERLTGRYRTAQ